MLAAMEREIEWGIDKASLNTPFLFSEREGQFLNVTSYQHGMNNETCLINSFSHTYSRENGWSNSYELAMKL